MIDWKTFLASLTSPPPLTRPLRSLSESQEMMSITKLGAPVQLMAWRTEQRTQIHAARHTEKDKARLSVGSRSSTPVIAHIHNATYFFHHAVQWVHFGVPFNYFSGISWPFLHTRECWK